VSRKIIVCRCEDVTLADVQHALAHGHRTVEEVKRWTGLGTGPCQGKECMAFCAQLTGATRPFQTRPPTQPVALGLLAGEEA
jgi:sarcosine oxidase subunit beta